MTTGTRSGAAGVSALVGGLARRMEPPERRTLSKVRRYSRPQGEGRYVMLTWREANERIRALHRWERRQQKAERHRNRAVGHIGVAVYEYLCRLAVNRRGRLDDQALGSIAGAVGYARSAVVAAIARLKRFGWLNWRRQYVETGERGARGPVVRQAPNFFWIEAPVAALLKMGIRFGGPPPPDDDAVRRRAEADIKRTANDPDSRLGAALAATAHLRQKRETS